MRETAGTTTEVNHIELRIAILADRAGQLIPIGSKTGTGICTGKLHQTDTDSRCQINHIDIRKARLIAGIGEFPGVGAETGGDTQSVVMCDLASICTIVISHADLLTTRLVTDKGNGAGGDPLVACQGLNDVMPE